MTISIASGEKTAKGWELKKVKKYILLVVRLQTKYNLSDCLDTYNIYELKEKAEEHGQVFRTSLQTLQTEWIVIYDSLEQSVARFGEVLYG